MMFIHKQQAGGRWYFLSLFEQLANVGSEVERAFNWQKKNEAEYSLKAFERGLELLDLTIADRRWRGRLKELTRLREVLGDYFLGDNHYQTSEEGLKKYFYDFSYAVRKNT